MSNKSGTNWIGRNLAGIAQSKEEANKMLERIKKASEKNFKTYEVYRSRIIRGQFDWGERFELLGTVKAFNSLHALEVGKQEFPAYAERMAVMNQNHPYSEHRRYSVSANTSRNLVKEYNYEQD